MNRFSCWLLLVAILVQRGLSVSTASDSPDEDDEEWDEDEDSSEVDDDSRIYKNPRNSPSTECPRDEEQATLLGQKCLRKCSSDEDCKSKKKKCLCDGVCGMSCIKPDRECPEITQPPLGTVTMSGNHFGARATYTCPHGYHVVGLQSRLCQADGHWAGQEPSCKQNIYCLTPPTIEHARHSALPEQATFDLDSNIQYHCHTGYVTAGFPRAKCLAIDGRASWYGPDIQCEPRSCNQPTDPAHGWHAGECYTFGCRITYHCSEGYELVGKVDRLCQADGSWTPKELPTCVLVTAVQCSLPENPKNGKAIYTSCSYNSVLSYECRYGYTLVGESSRRCGADRKWSGSLPVCKEINCGPPGILYNGWLENLEGGTGLGASIIFRCHPGMLLIGNSSSVCQIDGKWRYPVPECLAPCVVPAISQGTVIPMEAVEIDPNITTTFVTPTLTAITNKVKHGTMLEVMCENLYEFPVSSLALPTCSNGTWTIIPRCIPARCKTLPKYPKFGMVLAPKTEHGMKSRFKCKDGYKLTGPGGKEITDPNDYVLTCSFGNWTGETPMCQEVYCSFPGYIPHGKVLLVGNMGLYDYRPYVKKIVNNKQIMYDCDKGYVLGDGPIGATCVGGLWRPTELPSCLLGQHPRLRWTRKRRSVEMKHARSRYIRENWRRLQHKVQELLNHNNLYSKRKPRVEQYNNRSRRNSVESDIAYTKYYAKIRQRYRNYLLGIIRSSRAEEERRKSLSEPSDQNFKYTNISPSYRNDGTQSNDIPEKSVQSKGTYHRDRIRGAVEKQNLLKALIIRRKRSMDTEQGQEKKNNHRNEMNQTLEHQSDQEKGNTEIKKGKPREPCEAIETKSYFTIDIVREGRNPDNKFSAGTIVRIKCANEYKLNLENPNGTAKCVRGNWKPMKPDCILLPCTVPTTEHGTYFHMSSDAKPVPKQLNTFEEIVIDDYIDFQCDNGYNVQGSNRLKCVKGKWDPTPLPECAPAPCILPSINNAVYQEGYRGGLTIAHGSSVNIQCDNPLNNSPVQMVCRLGSLTPASIQCETGSRKSREEYLGEVEFVSAGNHELNSIMHGLTPDRFDSLPIPSSTGKDCGSPSRVDDALVYKNGEPIGETESGFQSGTEITFNCIVGSAGERITWKIICDDGSWVGRSLNCANGTCIFMNNEPNVVTFYNDLQIREDKVEFPPGATIISR